MKNLHIIATDKPSRLWFYKQTDILLTGLTVEKARDIDTQNIYITNDDEIKVGDWVIEFQKGDNIGEVHFINGEYVIANDIQKKIIITTDQDLERVQAINDEFLEWFVKNPSCEEIKVEITRERDGYSSKHKKWYKIIIPKEEPKQETLEEYIKEVLEDEFFTNISERSKSERLIRLGAQWQAERMYSEEEMLQALNIGFTSTDETWEECVEFTKEQFKKK